MLITERHFTGLLPISLFSVYPSYVWAIVIAYYVFKSLSLGESLGGVLDQGGNLADLDTISLESQAKLDVLDEAVKVITLEVAVEFVHERLHIGKVDQAIVHAKLHLEEVQDEGVGIRVRVVHVRLNCFGEVIARDVFRAVQSSLQQDKYS